MYLGATHLTLIIYNKAFNLSSVFNIKKSPPRKWSGLIESFSVTGKGKVKQEP